MPSARSFISPRRGAGFVLLEVLLATAIFSIVAVGIARAIASGADAVRNSDWETLITREISNRINEAQSVPVAVGIKREKPDARGVSFETEWASLKLENREKALLPGLYRLSVRARWMEGKREQTEEAVVDVYRPRL